jgi:precorrin-3B synthase
MTAASAIKGWCPTLLDPMPSGDGWLVRIKPSAATLGAEAARLVARLAARHGNGHIDLTSRANLQVRGLTPDSAERFAETVIGQGLAEVNPAREAIRNVMASPLGRDDPSAGFDSHEVARALESMLAREPELVVLPAKFGFLVDGGGTLPLQGVRADLMVRAFGKSIAIHLDGGEFAVSCTASTAAHMAKSLALAFLHLSRNRLQRSTRMRDLVRSVGEAAIFNAAGLETLASPQLDQPAPPPPVGFTPIAGQGEGLFGIGLPFGRIEADQLARLAGFAECYGDGTHRTTPWRILLLVGIDAASTDRLGEEIRDIGLIAEPSDARLYIYACVGAPACVSATVKARADAERLAAISGIGIGTTIHVSGCAKSCAHRGPAAVTLVGRDGRYDLVRSGAANDKPALTGLDIEGAAALLAAAGGERS